MKIGKAFGLTVKKTHKTATIFKLDENLKKPLKYIASPLHRVCDSKCQDNRWRRVAVVVKQTCSRNTELASLAEQIQ